MCDTIIDEVQPSRVRKLSVKRPRKCSPETKKGESEGPSLLLEAKRIQENVRMYLIRHEKKTVSSIREHINNKVNTLIDMFASLDNGEQERMNNVSSLVHRALMDALSTEEAQGAIKKIVHDNAVPRVTGDHTCMANLAPEPLQPQAGSGKQINIIPVIPDITEQPSEGFKLVTNKKRRKRAKPSEISVKPSTSQEIPRESQKEEKSQVKKMSLADIVRSLPTKPSESTRPTYITISGNGKRPGEIINGLPTPTEIGVKASIVRTTKAGSVLVRMEAGSDVNKVIGCKELRDKGLQARLALRKKPRLEVRGVPLSWDSAELVRFLWGRIPEKSVPTPLIFDDIRALFSSTARNGLTKNWVIEVHPIVRFLLLEIGSLDGGWWSIGFKDYLDAPRCSKCQGYGHSKATCTSNAVICIWCASTGHIIKDCPKKKEQGAPSCINCERVNAPLSQRKHKAGSRECPVHLKWAKEVAKRTFYE